MVRGQRRRTRQIRHSQTLFICLLSGDSNAEDTSIEMGGVNGTEDFLNTVSNANGSAAHQLNLLDQNFLKPHKSVRLHLFRIKVPL